MNEDPGWLRSGTGMLVLAMLAVAVILLVIDHAGHVFGILPYLLLACPVMHFFHGRHGRGGPHRGIPGSRSEGRPEDRGAGGHD
jgi:hypothetical protein